MILDAAKTAAPYFSLYASLWWVWLASFPISFACMRWTMIDLRRRYPSLASGVRMWQHEQVLVLLACLLFGPLAAISCILVVLRHMIFSDSDL